MGGGVPLPHRRHHRNPQPPPGSKIRPMDITVIQAVGGEAIPAENLGLAYLDGDDLKHDWLRDGRSLRCGHSRRLGEDGLNREGGSETKCQLQRSVDDRATFRRTEKSGLLDTNCAK
jgi:hypothetical protein